MAKWIFTRENGPFSYPTLGFTADTNDVIEADAAPDAWWEETDSEATVTIPVVPEVGVEEPADGSVLVYRRSTNRQTFEELDAAVVGAVPNTSEGRQALADSSELSATIGASAFGIAANTRPRGNRTILMGDSITAYNGGVSTATPAQSLAGYSSLGMWRWANVILDQRLDIIGNSGIGGQETSQIRARFQTDVLDLNPDILALLAGTNDDGPEDNTWDNLEWMYQTALTAGIFVVAFTIPPQTSSAPTNTTTMQNYRLGVNTLIRQFVRSHAGMVLVDLAEVWQDKTQPGFVGRADYLPDFTHPGTLGAQVAGYAVARAVSPLLPEMVQPLSSGAAPDNMLTNGRFAGSGSALPGGWSASGTATYAYVPGPGGVGQRLAVSVPVGGSLILTQNVNLGVLLREGDEYDFTVNIEPYDLETFGASAQRINAHTQNYTGSAFTERSDAVYIDGGAQYGSARYPARSGKFRTARGVFSAGKTLMQVVVTLIGGGTYLLSDAIARNLTMLEAGITAPESVPHTNLITNGTFETDAADWSANAGASVARSTAQKHSGVASLAIQHTADVQSDGRYKKVPVAPSTALNYVAWVNAPAGFIGKMNFNWYIGGGAFISQTSVNFTGTGQWQKLIATIAASGVPSNAGDMLLTVSRGDAVGTPLVYVDDVDVWQV